MIYANQQAMALPARNARATPDGPEYWIQPCGVPSEGGDPPAFDSDLANFYADHLYNDLLYLNNWKNTYVSQTAHTIDRYLFVLSLLYCINF